MNSAMSNELSTTNFENAIMSVTLAKNLSPTTAMFPTLPRLKGSAVFSVFREIVTLK